MKHNSSIFWKTGFGAWLLTLSMLISIQTANAADNDLDPTFLRTAYLNSQWKMEAGKIAVKQTETANVKSFAQIMVTHSSHLSSELANLLKKKGIGCQRDFDSLRRETLGYLSRQRGAGIDREYISMTVDDLTTDLNLYQKAAGQSKDPEIKSLAEKSLKGLKEDLALADKILRNIPPPVLK
ncbi:MAG: hypothetical protein C0407_13875 [Desulfobacca sp.]|nr:hypothetical protein [Desulfobacca sp.]